MATKRYFGHSLFILVAFLFSVVVRVQADTIVLQTGFESDTTGNKSAGATVGDGLFTVSDGPNPNITGFATVYGIYDPSCYLYGFLPKCLKLTDAVITSVNTFAPGDYQLMFDVFVPVIPLTVTLGNFTHDLSGTSVHQTRSFSFTLTSNANLIFTMPQGFSFLDNIKLTQIEQQTSIPEPSSMLLLGTGLVSLGGMIKRRRQRGK